MALELTLAKGVLSVDNKELTITDSTGTYDAGDNPGGYGSPNDERSDIVLKIRAYNKRVDDGDVLLSVESYDPETVATWTLNIHKQGWQQITVYGLDLYEASTASAEFDVDEIVYDAGANAMLRITAVNGGGPFTYDTVSATEADLENDNYTTAYSSVFNTAVTFLLDDLVNLANKAYLTEGFEESDYQLYRKLEAYALGIDNQFAFSNFSEAQLWIEDAEELGSCLLENT